MAKTTGWYEVTYSSGRVEKSVPKNAKHKGQLLKEIKFLQNAGSVTSCRWENGRVRY